MAGLLAAGVLGAACGGGGQPGPSPTPGTGGTTPAATAPPVLPPAPSIFSSPGGPGSPPVAWIGGTLVAVGTSTLRIEEPSGAGVVLRRLGAGATGFYRVAAGTWQPVDPPSGPDLDEPACAETLMTGTALLALRVFLGASCGPSAPAP